MKVLAFQKEREVGLGVLQNDNCILPIGWGLDRRDVQKCLPGAALSPGAGMLGEGFKLDQVRLLPPIPCPDKILAVGLNYRRHIEETGRPVPKRPMIFTRFANSQVGHDEDLVCPAASREFDYEGELAVVIGKRARNVRRADAESVIFGYSCYNDGSIRDWQNHTSQFVPGKNFPRTGAFGPWIVTRDEFGAVGDKEIVTRLNGNIVQQARLSDLIFDVSSLIEYCSSFTELVPGDVIVTGTPAGVGHRRVPQLWMKAGDVVEVSVTGIGTLRNRVTAEGL